MRKFTLIAVLFCAALTTTNAQSISYISKMNNYVNQAQTFTQWYATHDATPSQAMASTEFNDMLNAAKAFTQAEHDANFQILMGNITELEKMGHPGNPVQVAQCLMTGVATFVQCNQQALNYPNPHGALWLCGRDLASWNLACTGQGSFPPPTGDETSNFPPGR